MNLLSFKDQQFLISVLYYQNFNLIQVVIPFINFQSFSIWFRKKSFSFVFRHKNLFLFFFYILQKLASDDKLKRMERVRKKRTELGKNERIATEDGQNYGNDITVVARKRPGNLPVGPSACTLHLLRRRRATLPP